MAHHNRVKPVAIITGAGSGIGREIARLLGVKRAAGPPCELVLVGRRIDRLEAVARSIDADTRPLCVAADVSVPEAIEALVRQTVAERGGIDVVINNAGDAPRLTIGGHTAEIIDAVYRVNALGPANLIARAWPYLTSEHGFRDGSGERRSVVVNVSTIGTFDPFPGFFGYAAAKAAVNVMAASCANEGRASGVRAFSVAPGAVETGMLRALFSAEEIPQDKCLRSEEVAAVVCDCVDGGRDADNGRTIQLTRQ